MPEGGTFQCKLLEGPTLHPPWPCQEAAATFPPGGEGNTRH